MLSSFYGEYFLILQENKDKSIEDLVQEKPIIKEGLVGKLESITHKLIDKGMTRHTIVQAIIYDYLTIAEHEDRLELVNLLSEVFPAMLSSDKGLKAACGLWAIASSKDRRTIIKVIKPLVLEMAVNPISSFFLLYVCMTLDDTVQCKKSIVNALVKNFEDFSDKTPAAILYSCLLTGINMPIRNVIHKDMLEAITFLDSDSSSKKEEPVRRKEIVGNLVTEVWEQTENSMLEDLMGKHPFITLSLIQYAIEFDEWEEYLQQLYRNLNKEITSDYDGKKQKVICHISVHRHIKDLVIREIQFKKDDPKREMLFTTQIATLLKKDIQTHLQSRSVFIIATICQNDETKSLITTEDITKKMIKKALKEVKSQSGLKLLTDALYPSE